MPINKKVIWSNTAVKDLENIIQFIHQTRPATAKKILAKIKCKALTLVKQANRGRVLPELEHIPELPFRELIVSPWRLIYQIKKNVEVIAVLDSRRDLDEILFDRLMR